MTAETKAYADTWLKALNEIVTERTEADTFTMEFGEVEAGQEHIYIEPIGLEIITRALKVKVDRPGSPCFVLVGGAGAAGKTTFYKQLKAFIAEEKLGKKLKVQRIELDNYFFPLEAIGDRVVDGKYDNPRNSDLERGAKNIESLRKKKDSIVSSSAYPKKKPTWLKNAEMSIATI